MNLPNRGALKGLSRMRPDVLPQSHGWCPTHGGWLLAHTTVHGGCPDCVGERVANEQENRRRAKHNRIERAAEKLVELLELESKDELEDLVRELAAEDY